METATPDALARSVRARIARAGSDAASLAIDASTVLFSCVSLAAAALSVSMRAAASSVAMSASIHWIAW